MKREKDGAAAVSGFRQEALLLGGLLLLALFLRFLALGNTPLHPDELHYAYDVVVGEETASLAAVRDMDCAMLAERRTAHPMVATLLHRYFYFLPLDAFFPRTSEVLRSFYALAGAFLILPVWGAARLAWGPKSAMAAAALVALHPGLVWISRVVYLDIVYTFWLAVVLLGGAWALRSPSFWPAAVVGVAAGLSGATKISAPVFLPLFLAAGLLGPRELTRRQRAGRFGIAFLAALAVFVLLADPGAYRQAILHPPDQRYAEQFADTGPEEAAAILLVDLPSMIPALIWDAPWTLLLFLPIALRAGWRERDVYTGFVLLGLLCSLPLFLMHLPKLSGYHGLAPVWLFLVLLAAMPLERMPSMRTLLSVHVVWALMAIGAETMRGYAFAPPPRPWERDTTLFRLLKPWYAARDNPQVLLLEPETWFFYKDTVRHSQLAEGAVYFVPNDGQEARLPEALQWADVVVVHDPERNGAPLGLRRARDFVEGARNGGYLVYTRQEGQTRRSIALEELSALEDGQAALPGRVYNRTGTWTFDGKPVPPGTQPPAGGVAFDGFQNFLDRGTGRLSIHPEAPRDGVLRLLPPRPEGVFWGF